ncbi:MAG: acylphosphatase [Nitrospirales bacterium]|nr:MAG: acylphosphatase [Nitrospirales bacterium]
MNGWKEMADHQHIEESSQRGEQPLDMSLVRAHIVVEGRVQGVAYRAFTQQQATSLNLHGWVRNLPSGHVESEVEGRLSAVETFLNALRQGPSLAHVEHIHIEWISVLNDVGEFRILRS